MTGKPDPYRSSIHDLGLIVLTILSHIVVLAVLILGGWALHHLLEAIGDPKLYDLVPWRYLIDTADVGLIVSFIVYGTISFMVVVRGRSEPPVASHDEEHQT